MPSTARIGRALFHRARSASKEGTWPLPPYPPEAVHCASTQRDLVDLLSPCFLGAAGLKRMQVAPGLGVLYTLLRLL
ncbi:MAG: hypothetical protein ABIU05_21070, partial [Nitrospirales bacterium]